ncbi:MAG TPA: ATP-binding protein, partial [Hanamia sp.]|nr:ATP-binding protein [Hanamia sp.]
QEINDDLNNYFRSNINGQLFVDADMKLMKFSPGAVKQINLLESDVGRPLSHIATNIKLDTITEDIKKVIEDGMVITKEIETNNGLWYQVMTMPYIRQADNVRSGAILTFNDITELKKVQDELNKKNKSLQRINEDLDNFVHVASHDLLSPLGNIELSIDLMNQIKVDGKELNKILEIINTSIKKFRSLVTEMASIGKVESEMISMETVDLDEIIDDIEWSLNSKIVSAGAVINRNLEVKQIYFSKKNLRSIVYNLISNSLKFNGDSPPVINIKTTKDGNTIILSVQDNGIGLKKADTLRIFNLYGRLHHDIEGQGIGLFLAKKMIDAAGGNVTVESELGKGTTIIIHFKMEQ